MSRNGNETVCDGCGRVFDAELPAAQMGEHRDYCGTCAHNRSKSFEIEVGDRRVMATEAP